VLDTVQTFVASCPHCPEHRREFILKELLLAIDAEEYLGEYDLFSHLFIHLPYFLSHQRCGRLMESLSGYKKFEIWVDAY